MERPVADGASLETADRTGMNSAGLRGIDPSEKKEGNKRYQTIMEMSKAQRKRRGGEGRFRKLQINHAELEPRAPHRRRPDREIRVRRDLPAYPPPLDNSCQTWARGSAPMFDVPVPPGRAFVVILSGCGSRLCGGKPIRRKLGTCCSSQHEPDWYRTSGRRSGS